MKLFIHAITKSGAEYIIDSLDGRLIHTTSRHAKRPIYPRHVFILKGNVVAGQRITLYSTDNEHRMQSTPVEAVAVAPSPLSPLSPLVTFDLSVTCEGR